MCNVSLHSADTAPSNLDLNGWYDVDNIIQRKKEWYKKSGIVIENIDLVEQIVGDYRRCGDNTLTGLKLTLEPLFNGNKRLLIDFIGGMLERPSDKEILNKYIALWKEDTSLARFAARSIIRGLVLYNIERNKDHLFEHLKTYSSHRNYNGLGDARKLLTILYNHIQNGEDNEMPVSEVLSKLFVTDNISEIWPSDEYTEKRKTIDTGYYIEQYFHAHNVRFIAVTDQFDTADSGNLHGGIMLPLKNMINEAYALDIGRKIKAQARQAMKDGDYIGARAPYGYRKDPDNCHKLLIDENTAPVVKQIFEWAHEHVALNRIVRNLNEMGIPAPSHYKKTTGEITSPGLIGSGKWQTRTVMKILESEVYTGDLVQGKTKIVDHQQVKAGEDNLIIAKCTHEPIISHELFNAVQEYRKQICEESKATPKRPYTPNIFKGKVFCADCGRSLHRQRAERRKGPDTYWFHCLTNSRVEKDSCKGAMIQEKELISTVTAILEKELTVALGMSLPLFQLEARQKQEKDKLKIQMSAKRQEIEKIRRLIRGLYENFVQGILTNDEYFELKADYEHAINALSGEIEVFEKSMDSLDNQLAKYRAMEKDAKTLAQDHVLTAKLIERLIERIEIDHERNIHVTFRFKNEFQGKAVEPCATM